MEYISLNDNPYEEMVDDCIKRQSHHFDKPSPQRPWVQQMAPEEFLPADFQMPTPPHTAVRRDMDQSQINKPGIKITFNDDEDDDDDDSLANLETRYNSYWVSRLLLRSGPLLIILLAATSTVEIVSIIFSLLRRRVASIDSPSHGAFIFQLCIWQSRTFEQHS